MKTPILIAVAALITASAALAHDYELGSLVLEHPHAKATLPGAPVSGGYLTIRNTGAESDRLVSAEAAFAGKVEIHQMKMDGDVMQMRPVEGGLEIPAGGEVVLERGGFHIMFMQMSGPLEAGSKQNVTLTFEKAGKIEVEFAVEEMQPGSHGKYHE
jgi:periplasmic copper chaperone A